MFHISRFNLLVFNFSLNEAIIVVYQYQTFVPCVLVEQERLAVGVDAERAELLQRAATDGGAPGPAVQPQEERRRLRAFSLLELVVQRVAGLLVDGDVAAVHVERHTVGLPRQPQDAILVLLLLLLG